MNTSAADRLLKEAGVNPAPPPEWHPYYGGHALFIKGRLRAWYRVVPNQPHLFDCFEAHRPLRRETVLGEEVAREVCLKWLEEQERSTRTRSAQEEA